MYSSDVPSNVKDESNLLRDPESKNLPGWGGRTTTTVIEQVVNMEPLTRMETEMTQCPTVRAGETGNVELMFDPLMLKAKKRREGSLAHSILSGKKYYEKVMPRITFYSPNTGSVMAHKLSRLKWVNPVTKEEKGPFELFQLGGPWWLDVCGATQKEVEHLMQVFHIHPLTAEDVLTEDTREKCEVFRQYYFVSYRSYVSDEESEDYLEPMPVYAIVYPMGLISFHPRNVPHIQSVLLRVERLKGQVDLTSDWLCYALLDDITDHYAPLITQVQYAADSIDDLSLVLKESDRMDMIHRTAQARKLLILAQRLLKTKADVLRALAKWLKHHGNQKTNEVRLYLGDVLDHAITMTHSLTTCDATLTRAHSNYLSQINVELAEASNKTNAIVTRFTVFAQILFPLNIITGLFGMNVHIPGQGGDTFIWFAGILTGMLVIIIVGVLFARRMRWM